MEPLCLPCLAFGLHGKVDDVVVFKGGNRRAIAAGLMPGDPVHRGCLRALTKEGQIKEAGRPVIPVGSSIRAPQLVS